MRYIEIKLDSTTIQMEPVTIRQYNNLVDTVVVQLKSDMDGLVVEDYNVFIQTDLIRRDKIPLTPCRSSVDIVVEEGYLGYTWPIDSAVTRYKGVLQFEVQLEHKTDAAIPIWQSEVCELITVAPNICDNTALGGDGPAILQEVYQQLQTLDDQVDQAAASATNAAESKRLAGISATETVEAASLLLSGYVTDAQTAKTGAETAQGLAEEAQGAAEAAQGKAETASDTAEREANRAEREADDAEGSKENAATSETVATQAMTDLLAMLGSDIATLTDGKLTPSQIPALSINDVFEVETEEDMIALTAERGDVALILSDGIVEDSYILAADDPTLQDNWKKLGISYVANAGHASTADSAVNADKINNKRMVAMTQNQYDTAVIEPNTIYIVTPDGV